MYSSAYLQEARSELARLKKERAAIDRAVELLEQILALDAGSQVAKVGAQGPIKSSLKDEIEHVLREAGKPLHYNEVYRQLLTRGVHVPGKDPARNVGAHLSADLRFKSVGAGRWALADDGAGVSETPHREAAEEEDPSTHSAGAREDDQSAWALPAYDGGLRHAAREMKVALR